MKKQAAAALCALIMLLGLGGCAQGNRVPKIGVSFGVGAATRWVNEKAYMEERAKELGAEIEARLNTTDEPTQLQDCKELIDSGIDVLILIPRDANNVKEILDYAREKEVKVISYARVVLGQHVDLFVGYDSGRIGQTLGQYLAEMVYKGDYIILSGDTNDNNANLLYEGAMRYLEPLGDNVNVLLDAPVPNWSSEEAKSLVREVVMANGNHVDAIFAPNDKIAGACAEVLAELGITDPVIITGMDAELEAARRIVAGTQSVTIYMDLRELSRTAVDQACNMALGAEVEVNAEFDNRSGTMIDANLTTGKLVTRENLDKILIESGYFTRAEVYGS